MRDRKVTAAEQMMPDTREVAPLLTLRAVRARAAVPGIPPKHPATTLAMERARTSCRWLNLVLVILSANLRRAIRGGGRRGVGRLGKGRSLGGDDRLEDGDEGEGHGVEGQGVEGLRLEVFGFEGWHAEDAQRQPRIAGV